MNKKLMLILTFIVSFIVSIGSVKADSKKLDCWYKRDYDKGGNVTASIYKMEQDNNGNRKYYTFTSNNLNEKVLKNEDFSNTKTYNSGVLTECPKCMKFDKAALTEKYSVVASDSISSSVNGDINASSCPDDYSINISAPSNSGNDATVDADMQCEEKWDIVCKYGYNKDHSQTLVLKFNENNFSLSRAGNSVPDKIESSSINISDILAIKNGKCPSNIQSSLIENKNFGNTIEHFYLSNNSSATANRVYTQISYKNCKDAGDDITVYVVNNCRDLFGEDVIEIINMVMKYIGIIVPILLLVYGVSDFFMAIFAGDPEKMVDRRKKFFKRLIAAVIVFLVPIFVKFVLKISNSVWSDIHADTCVNEDYE